MAMTTAQISAAIAATLTEFNQKRGGLTFLSDADTLADLQDRLEVAVDDAASD